VPIEEAFRGRFCMDLWESGRQGMRTRAGLDCLRKAVLARVNTKWTFGHVGSQLVAAPGEAG
jgi:hypothetical protein